MSFLVKPINDNFLQHFIAVCDSQRTAYALDAFLTIAANLQETTVRISERLTQLSQSDTPHSQPPLHRFLIADIWAALDGMSRAFALAPILGMVSPPPGTETIIPELKKARNSYQHLEARLEHFFSTNQGSPLGNLYWRYRTSIQEPERWFYLQSSNVGSGGSLNHGTINAHTAEHNAIFAKSVGVYDLQILYLEGSPNNRNHSPLTIKVDLAAALINSLIDGITSTCRASYQDALTELGVSSLPIIRPDPFVIRFTPATGE